MKNSLKSLLPGPTDKFVHMMKAWMKKHDKKKKKKKRSQEVSEYGTVLIQNKRFQKP